MEVNEIAILALYIYEYDEHNSSYADQMIETTDTETSSTTTTSGDQTPLSGGGVSLRILLVIH